MRFNMSHLTAQTVFLEFRKLPSNERAKFYALLAEGGMAGENASHEQVFGHLVGEEFSAAEAAQYLEVSMSTFRRFVADGKLRASSEIGRSQLFSTKDLRSFKRSRQEIKGVKPDLKTRLETA